MDRGDGILRIGVIGIVAAIMAAFIRKERGELSVMIALAAGCIIFYYVLSQISVVVQFFTTLLDMIALEETYYMQLLKMLGVAYVAEFASSICRDSGQQAIAGVIELFGKISIVVLSIPGMVFLIETLEKFV